MVARAVALNSFCVPWSHGPQTPSLNRSSYCDDIFIPTPTSTPTTQVSYLAARMAS